jgi:hypothetical protein
MQHALGNEQRAQNISIFKPEGKRQREEEQMKSKEIIKVRVNFTLELGIKAQRGSRGVSLLSLNLGARWWWVVNATPRPLYRPRKDPASIE